MLRLLKLHLIVALVIVQVSCIFPEALAEDLQSVKCELFSEVSNVTFGDSLTVVCTVEVPQGYRITEPSLEVSGKTDKAHHIWQRTIQTDNSGSKVSYGFLIYAFSPDSLNIGPAQVEVTGSDGESYTVRSEMIVLPVRTVLAAADSIPYPSRPPVRISAHGIPFWLFVLIASVVLLICVMLYYLWKRKIPASVSEAERPIDEIEEFLKIAGLALHEKGRIKDLYILVSAAMRGFLHRNMPFDARHETTTEIIRELGKTDYNHLYLDIIRDILLEADQVKFAKYIPSWDESSTIVDRALKPVKAILEENHRRLSAALQEASETVHSDSLKDEPDVLAEVNGRTR